MKVLIISTILLLLLGGAMLADDNQKTAPAPGQTATGSLDAKSGEQIKWQVISDGGGNNGSSANYRLSGTTGQTATGDGSSASYGLSQGFWQQSAVGPQYTCGDADGNGLISISDAVYLVNYIFGGGPAPDPLAAGDADCNGLVSISDAVYLINYIFGGGAAPCATCP